MSNQKSTPLSANSAPNLQEAAACASPQPHFKSGTFGVAHETTPDVLANSVYELDQCPVTFNLSNDSVIRGKMARGYTALGTKDSEVLTAKNRPKRGIENGLLKQLSDDLNRNATSSAIQREASLFGPAYGVST